MLKILLDTNILHQEGLQSARMQVLQRLIKANKVKLFLPEIVVEEYRSRREFYANEEFQKIINSIGRLKRKNLLYSNISMFSYSIETMNQETIEQINSEIDKWIEENDVELYKISNTCIDKLFKDYFQGNGAFREKKKRDDFPDAVIFDAIEKLSKNDKLYVVVNDSGIKDAIKAIDSIQCFSKLEEFLNLEDIKNKIEVLNKENIKIEKTLSYLDSTDCTVSLAYYYEEDGMESLVYNYTSENIELSYEFDDIEVLNPTLKAKISNNYDELLTSNASYLGNNKFSLDYTLDIDVDLAFSCEEEDYESLPYQIRKILSSSKNETSNNLQYSGIFKACYNGVIILSNIDEDLSAGELKIHFSYLGTDKCEITCNDSIVSVAITDFDSQ